MSNKNKQGCSLHSVYSGKLWNERSYLDLYVARLLSLNKCCTADSFTVFCIFDYCLHFALPYFILLQLRILNTFTSCLMLLPPISAFYFLLIAFPLALARLGSDVDAVTSLTKEDALFWSRSLMSMSMPAFDSSKCGAICVTDAECGPPKNGGGCFVCNATCSDSGQRVW
jgi:hypothetical protein